MSDEKVELDVDGNVLEDDINYGVIDNDIDDHVAMVDPFNTDCDHNDTDIQLDEEEDQ